MRWKLTLAYDGTDFAGWQSQPRGPTVQELLQQQLEAVCNEPVCVHGSGRTDSGVHARGQVCHFDANWVHGPEKLLVAIGSQLPDSVQLLALTPAEDDFHARFSATGKCYHYQIFNGVADPFQTRYHWSSEPYRLNPEWMALAAHHLIGEHDFSAFTVNPKDCRNPDPSRSLRQLDIVVSGPQITIVATANGFLFRMVRSLAGCLFDVGRGRIPIDEVPEILAAKIRTGRVRTAPPHGLFLHEVYYP